MIAELVGYVIAVVAALIGGAWLSRRFGRRRTPGSYVSDARFEAEREAQAEVSDRIEAADQAAEGRAQDGAASGDLADRVNATADRRW